MGKVKKRYCGLCGKTDTLNRKELREVIDLSIMGAFCEMVLPAAQGDLKKAKEITDLLKYGADRLEDYLVRVMPTAGLSKE